MSAQENVRRIEDPGDPIPRQEPTQPAGKSRKTLLRSIVLWAIAVAATLACLAWQDQTGPTYPLQMSVPTAKGDVKTEFLRSETIGAGLKVMLQEPVPPGITGYVRYRRFTSQDAWTEVPLEPGEFEFSRRGDVKKVKGFGATLPSLKERAGKYEYFVYLNDGSAESFSVTGEKPILARYKGSVPMLVLGVHILVVFLAMLFAVRTSLEAIVDGSYGWMLWATIVSFVLGAFVLGPIVQWYAFRVWWSGWPLGGDWTDNKVVVELLAWVIALALNWGKRRNRWAVLGAGLVTLAVYFIPHSIFGSEYNYATQRGRGTTG